MWYENSIMNMSTTLSVMRYCCWPYHTTSCTSPFLLCPQISEGYYPYRPVYPHWILLDSDLVSYLAYQPVPVSRDKKPSKTHVCLATASAFPNKSCTRICDFGAWELFLHATFHPGSHKALGTRVGIKFFWIGGETRSGEVTSRCSAPVKKVTHDNSGIMESFMTTDHAITSIQKTMNNPSGKQ
ncbi:hypothetical protein J0S82_009589 [Galemys pyrenaicus]|uniref:Uncharacterized protein n=1 Tax=Galemys pyrenaicus TaxID=202257 RepID=A0A8J5ZYJ5_GALPY|nr:hypothetical protein J0S82_009589 [Galemys pyrenaicus]